MKSFKILNSNSHLLILSLWFINDIAFKLYFPNFFVGKISDIIGIYLSPFILTSIIVTVFYKFNEETVFYFCSSLIFIIFLLINISQEINNRIYEFLEIGFKNKGTADLTDLICLFMLIPSYIKFRYHRTLNDNKQENKFILLLSFVVFINSPAEPTGRSDVLSVLFLLYSTTDVIYLETPIDHTKVSDLENFKFRFIGKNNESEPPSIESLTIPETCSNVNEIPEPRDYPLSENFSNSQPLMHFDYYIIQISQDSDFKTISLQNNCSSINCNFDLSILESNFYYWKVLTHFTFIDQCIRYFYEGEPKQILGIFNK
ncbi:hypothetical protein P3G55_13130 [Leptospira sp. 96542]|nr:hypothetical protein [Leptospira sp. 96542]